MIFYRFRQITGLFFCFVLTACSPSSMQDFCEEGEQMVDEIADLLEQCRSREDLQKNYAKLKRRFNALVELVIEAKEFELKHPHQSEGAFSDGRASDRLRAELQRLFYLDGGRCVIEQSQREALDKLDLFEKRLHKVATKS